MTAYEAIDKGIKTVRLKRWNKYARLELPIGKPYGVWAKLIDPPSNLAMGNPAEHNIALLLLKTSGTSIDPNEDGWEEWIRPTDYDEWLEKQAANDSQLRGKK